MKLHLGLDNGVTIIDNTFIDHFMADANGEYVKLYLYLLRCGGAGRELSISSIADFFDHTEKDIKRALTYWEKQDVLRLRYDEYGNISDIILCAQEQGEQEISREDYALKSRQAIPSGSLGRIIPITQPLAGSALAAEPSDALTEADCAMQPDRQVAPKKGLTPVRKRALKEQEDIRQLFFVAETYLGRTLTAAEGNNLLYFYDSLHFSTDLIEYLVEYCAAKGNPGARYMERVALSWYEKGITTVQAAKQENAGYQKDYYDILAALGLKGRAPAPREMEYMRRWREELGFSMDIILEACARSILLTARPSIRYTDGILKSWHESGVESLADIQTLDQAHAERKDQPRAMAQSGTNRTGLAKGSGAGRFGNFQQRDYNYDALEQQLLAAQGAKGE